MSPRSAPSPEVAAFEAGRSRPRSDVGFDDSPAVARPALRGRLARLKAARPSRAARVAVNLVGATGAALFVRAGLQYYQRTHTVVGAAFLLEQVWIVMAYLIRRPARDSSQRVSDWLVAVAGTFGGVVLRPNGAHPAWGLHAGTILQVLGLLICVWSFACLGRRFGCIAADRGVAERGPYSIVRHPIYAAYVLLLVGYVLESASVRNAAVAILVIGCNVARARAEERLLTRNPTYLVYRQRVPWRFVPGLW